ncbi:MAG: DUF1552 domain-containing protein, partial [Planctomycetaceae bacterium]|nr:DUF1552 domain-containing protein [Planctomycetaceae bacterium]
MMTFQSRRDFMKHLGLGAASLPFLTGFSSLGFANSQSAKQRLIVVFSPNGVIPGNYWPDLETDEESIRQRGTKTPATGFPMNEGPLGELKPILKPFEPWKDKLLTIKGVCDLVKGDGDQHMRGMGCLLTGVELFPGNIQGGSHTPAGWASGLSIDQEIRRALQANPETTTRFGSLEYGVLVPERADTWTRMVYAGPNKPVAPIDDPYQMLSKMYGKLKDRDSLKSILDPLQQDLALIREKLSVQDRALLDEQAEFVRTMEKELQQENSSAVGHAVPQLELGVRESNDNMPKITRMQMDLLVNALKADFTRVATFQFTNSVGQAKMTWLGIEEGHHGLSHEPDSNEDAVDKLTRINTWYAEQIAYLAQQLASTPEPNANGSMLPEPNANGSML